MRQENKAFIFGLVSKIHSMDSAGLVGLKPPSYSQNPSLELNQELYKYTHPPCLSKFPHAQKEEW